MLNKVERNLIFILTFFGLVSCPHSCVNYLLKTFFKVCCATFAKKDVFESALSFLSQLMTLRVLH